MRVLLSGRSRPKRLAKCGRQDRPGRDALGAQADAMDLRTIQGVAGRKLVETAAEARAELVVLATRGSVSLLPGAVSQYMLRRAPCPVLVVPEADKARGSGNHWLPPWRTHPHCPGGWG